MASDPHAVAPLPAVHKKLILTSHVGAMRQTGPVAILAVAMSPTTAYMRNHPADYRAYVTCGDTLEISQQEFNDVFTVAARLLKRQLHDEPSRVKVCAHCAAGINRSVTMIMAYILQHTTLNAETCLRGIRQANARYRGMPALTNKRFQYLLKRLPNQMARMPAHRLPALQGGRPGHLRRHRSRRLSGGKGASERRRQRSDRDDNNNNNNKQIKGPAPAGRLRGMRIGRGGIVRFD
jgi:hypothetical protein